MSLLSLALLFMLGQDECRPASGKGLSSCPEATYSVGDHLWHCKAACYTGARRPDGGLIDKPGGPVKATGGTKDYCLAELAKKCPSK